MLLGGAVCVKMTRKVGDAAEFLGDDARKMTHNVRGRGGSFLGLLIIGNAPSGVATCQEAVANQRL